MVELGGEQWPEVGVRWLEFDGEEESEKQWRVSVVVCTSRDTVAGGGWSLVVVVKAKGELETRILSFSREKGN